jgi:Ran GTPase-activating protein (RanGAP) involved in mRNA processing and transport
MKYFKCTADATKLILADCQLDDDALMEITSCLLQIRELKLEELDLSDNLIQDVGCKHMAAILMSTKIKRINLSKNPMIDDEGFKEICKAIHSNRHIQSIDLHDCGIDLSGATGWQ